jgi:hypothetical protein
MGGRGGRGPADAPPAAPASANPASTPANVTVGNLFYGSEGWASMDDAGFQAYKGESGELVMEEHPERGPGSDGTSLHMENFLAACRSRNVKDLHDPISNAHFSAGLCHLANIHWRSYTALYFSVVPTALPVSVSILPSAEPV